MKKNLLFRLADIRVVGLGLGLMLAVLAAGCSGDDEPVAKPPSILDGGAEMDMMAQLRVGEKVGYLSCGNQVEYHRRNLSEDWRWTVPEGTIIGGLPGMSFPSKLILQGDRSYVSYLDCYADGCGVIHSVLGWPWHDYCKLMEYETDMFDLYLEVPNEYDMASHVLILGPNRLILNRQNSNGLAFAWDWQDATMLRRSVAEYRFCPIDSEVINPPLCYTDAEAMIADVIARFREVFEPMDEAEVATGELVADGRLNYPLFEEELRQEAAYFRWAHSPIE